MAHYFNALAPRAQKGYLRISLTRCASCIVPASPAMAAAERVSSACAPENAPRYHVETQNYASLPRNFVAACHAELLQT